MSADPTGRESDKALTGAIGRTIRSQNIYSERIADLEAGLREAVAALRSLNETEWRITSGSIGPLMDVGYAEAGRTVKHLTDATLASLESRFPGLVEPTSQNAQEGP